MAATALPKRPALGKGLEALLPSRPSETVPSIQASAAHAVAGIPLHIAVDLIEKNPYQTRAHFDGEQIAELANSIRTVGVVQPITVRALGESGRYGLIAGERRWLASKQAGKTVIPAFVVKATDHETMEMTIVENLQRTDLNPMEQARAFDRLGREFHQTQEQVAARTGKDRATVGNFLRLLRLPEPVQQQVEWGTISFGHAKALMALESKEQVMAAAKKVVSLQLPVRATENMVKGILDPERKIGKAPGLPEEIDPNVKEAQEKIQRTIGLRTKILDRRGRGKIVIEYGSLEDFDTLMGMLTR